MTNNKDPTYDCTGCRYGDQHGLVCDVCIRKILDEHRARPQARTQADTPCQPCTSLED